MKKFEFNKSMVVKVVAVILVLALGSGVGAFASSKLGKKKTALPEKIITEEKSLDSATVSEMIMPASELVTMKYAYTKVGTSEKHKEAFGKKIPLTTDKTLYTYNGVVSAGVDLSEMVIDIDNENKVINITLTAPKILSHEIDTTAFKSWDLNDSVFTKSTMSDYIGDIDTLKNQVETELNEDSEFFDSVTDSTKNVVEGLLNNSENTKEYEIVFI